MYVCVYIYIYIHIHIDRYTYNRASEAVPRVGERASGRLPTGDKNSSLHFLRCFTFMV